MAEDVKQNAKSVLDLILTGLDSIVSQPSTEGRGATPPIDLENIISGDPQGSLVAQSKSPAMAALLETMLLNADMFMPAGAMAGKIGKVANKGVGTVLGDKVLKRLTKESDEIATVAKELKILEAEKAKGFGPEIFTDPNASIEITLMDEAISKLRFQLENAIKNQLEGLGPTLTKEESFLRSLTRKLDEKDMMKILGLGVAVDAGSDEPKEEKKRQGNVFRR